VDKITIEALNAIKNYTKECDVIMCEDCELYYICKKEICDWDLSDINVVDK